MLFPLPSDSTPAPKASAARAAKVTSRKRPSPNSVAEIVREYGPAVVLKMAQMACDGEVRAAALMFKLLEKEEPEAGGEALAQFTGALAGVERTVAGEILSLLHEQGDGL